MSARRRIAMRRVGDAGAVVRLPELLWLLRAFRAAFPRARACRRAWIWFVPGRTALRRLGAFDAKHGAVAAREVRERERARQDAEWEREWVPLRRHAA